MNSRPRLRALCAALLLPCLPALLPATLFEVIWEGTGDAGSTGDQNNWPDDTIPELGGLAVIRFGPLDGLPPAHTVTFDSDAFVYGLYFAGDRPAYTFIGNQTLTLAGNLDVEAGADVVFGSDVMVNLGNYHHSINLGEHVAVTVNGDISDHPMLDGNASVTQYGSGRLTLAGINTFGGGFQLAGGTLVLGSSSTGAMGEVEGYETGFEIVSGPLGTNGFKFDAGATLSVFDNTPITLHNDIELGCDPETGSIINIAGGSQSLFLLGTLTGSSPLVKTGAGVLVLGTNYSNGHSSSYFNGGVEVEEGTLRIQASSDNSDGIYGPLGRGGLILRDGTTLQSAHLGENYVIHNQIEVDGSGVTIETPGSSRLFLFGDITGSAKVTKTGTGELALGSFDDYEAEWLDTSYSDFAGGFVLQQGTLILGSSSQTGEGGLRGPVGSGTLEMKDSTLLAMEGTYRGLALHNALVIQDESTATVLINDFQELDLLGNISGTGSVLRKTGGGSLDLSGNNTFSGKLLVSEGAVEISGNTAAGNGIVEFDAENTATVNFHASAPVIRGLSGGSSAATLAILGEGKIDLTINQDGNTTYSGLISGAADKGLVKTGTGALSLAGSNTYGGGTIINGGTLVATNSSALGSGGVMVNDGGILAVKDTYFTNPLTLNPGSRLAGNGSLNDATIGGGVTLAPGLGFGLGGSRLGEISFQDLTLGHDGTLELDLKFNGGEFSHDVVHVQNDETLTILADAEDPFTLKLISLNSDSHPGTLTHGSILMDHTYSLTFLTANGIEGDLVLGDNVLIDASGFNAGFNTEFDLVRIGNNFALNLTFSPVPEPSTYALMALGLGFIGVTVWRRRRA